MAYNLALGYIAISAVVVVAYFYVSLHVHIRGNIALFGWNLNSLRIISASALENNGEVLLSGPGDGCPPNLMRDPHMP